MSYYTVLGYTNNILLDTYKEKYFDTLIKICSNINEETNLLESFFQLTKEKQKSFLLHPDIASLLQNISSSYSLKKFLSEMEYFLSGKTEKITMYAGENISGTAIKLTLHDNNPQNLNVGHPDHDREGMLGWGNKSESQWLQIFGKAFVMLSHIDKGFFDELNQNIKKIVPMKTSIDVHNSCSYGDCIGTLYIGYETKSKNPEFNILEALIHESSHNKLNLIMKSEKLHINDASKQFYSPYRPDARHIHGVLLGVHAIVPSVYILLQAIEKKYILDSSWNEKVILYHIKNKIGLRVLLKYGKFTSRGRNILDDMIAVMKICDSLIKENVEFQKMDLQKIQEKAKQHLLEVKHNYPTVQY